MTPPSWRQAPIAAPLPETPSPIRLGLGANWPQFTLLVVVNAFVGAMVGLERTVVPLIAQADFGLVSKTVVLSFLVSFGIVKALANLFAGQLADRVGRKPLLVAGWLAGLPVPLLVIWAPSWGWIVFANVLLGVNQGLCWSTTVIMKIDLVGPARRGLAMGLNEFAGYVAVSLSALLTGYLAAAHGLRPAPFYPGIAFAMAGLLLSVFAVRDTHGHARAEARQRGSEQSRPGFARVFLLTNWRDRALFAASQAGMVNNLNDGMVWGLIPVFLAARGVTLDRIGVVTATYPLVWGIGQLGTEVDDRERDVGAGGRHCDVCHRPVLGTVVGRGHALGDRYRAGLPYPARRRLRCRAPRLAGERDRHLPAVARLRLRRRRDRRRGPGGCVHHALRHRRHRSADLRLGSGRGRSHVRDPTQWIYGLACRADQHLTGATEASSPRMCFFAPASVQDVEQVRGRHPAPEVHEAFGCRNPFEAAWLRVRDPAADREGPSAPIIILDPEDREARRAPRYARNRCKRSLPPHQASDPIVAAPCHRVARVPGLPRSAPGGCTRGPTAACRSDERPASCNNDLQLVGRRRRRRTEDLPPDLGSVCRRSGACRELASPRRRRRRDRHPALAREGEGHRDHAQEPCVPSLAFHCASFPIPP